MKESDFNALLTQLESNKQKCILVLGPEFINIDSNDVDFTVSIHDYLANQKFADKAKDHYLSDDGFLFYDNFNELDKSVEILEDIGEFYKKLTVTESYEKLSRIPFTAIISLSPDDLMEKAYKKISKKCIPCAYSGTGFEEAPEVSSKDVPMIYNLVGKYEDSSNLLFTFDNLFSFLNTILQNTGNDKLRAHIKSATSFLFLGFNYDKWYLKLIFFLLRKYREEKIFYQQHAVFNYMNKNIDESDPLKIKYFKASFRLNFSRENENKFVERLYDSCREKGILSDVNSIQEVNEDLLETRKKERYKILFLGTSPRDQQTLRLGEMSKKIKDALKSDFYELLDPIFEFKRGDILDLVNTSGPSLLYFNCHGNEDGQLALSGSENNSDDFPLEELKELIEQLVVENTQINCIVFAACKSEKQAKEISKIVPYCIGMNQPVLEEVARIFTSGFFKGFIKDKQNFEYAFNMGVLSIKTCENDQLRKFYKIPTLYKNGVEYKMSIDQ